MKTKQNSIFTGQSVGVPSALKIVVNWFKSESPGRKGVLSINSAKMHPAAQMSTAPVYKRAPKRSSGARYQRVTTRGVIEDPEGKQKSRAKPKSASFNSPVCPSINKFPGFKS
jgi:hypothetical protein